MIHNLYELAQALGLPENTSESLTNQAAGWLYQHEVSATSGKDGLRLTPIGSFESTLLPWPITLDQLNEYITS